MSATSMAFVIALAATVAGCASLDYRRASEDDTEAAYRAFLDVHEDGEEAQLALARLEELAFQRARRGDDIAAYNRFLAEFPEGDFAREARERRAALRVTRALASNDPASALRRVIEDDAATDAARDARARLERLEAEDAERSDEPARLRAYLLTFPDGEARRAVERRLDDLEFEAAREAASESALRDYLEAHPRGIHRAEATNALEALEAERLIAAGRIDAMEAFLDQHPGAEAAEPVRRAVASELIERAETFLDAEAARRVLDLEPEGPFVERAQALIERMRCPSKRLATIREHLAELVGGLAFRGADELRDALDADDPRARWDAVREVALSDDVRTLDVAVHAAGGRDPVATFIARAALASWGDQRADQATAPLESWRRRLRARSSNPEDLLRLAVVSEALGERGAAARAYREAARNDETALAGAALWALLASDANAEPDAALRRFVEVAHERLRDLNDAVPDEIDDARWVSSLQVLRGLEGLARLAAEVSRAQGAIDPEVLAAVGDADSPALDDLDRLRAAASAAARRLAARMRRHDSTFDRDGDPLRARARDRRRRRLAAVEALGRLRANEAIPALKAVVLENDEEVSRAALRALARLRAPAARAALLEIARNEALAAALRHETIGALRAAARLAPASARAELEDAANALSAGAAAPAE